MELPHTPAIHHTRTWIRDVVIGLNFCPFAARPFREDRIRYVEVPEAELGSVLETVIREAWHLDVHPDTETTLIVLPGAWPEFEEYLGVADLADQLLIDQEYEGIYQIATFHPDYRFADTEPDDPGNFTNRSPYPMLHLLREETITRVLKTYPDPEGIPDRNRELAQAKGLAAMIALRDACFRDPDGNGQSASAPGPAS